MAVNKQILVGNLGRDPEIRNYENNFKTATFTVAVTKKGYRLENGTQVPDHTEWFNIYVSGDLAKVVEQYLHKGDRVYIEGETYTSEYTDKQGVQKRFTEVRCSVLEMLNTKPVQNNAQQQNTMQQQAYQPQQQAYAPQQQAYFPQQQAYQPQQGYAPAPQQYAQQPVQQAYVPQQQAVAPQQGVFGQPAQVQQAQGDAPF